MKSKPEAQASICTYSAFKDDVIVAEKQNFVLA